MGLAVNMINFFPMPPCRHRADHFAPPLRYTLSLLPTHDKRWCTARFVFI